MFDWVEIWAVGRKEQQPCASCSDRGPDVGLLVAGQVVEDDDVTWPQRRTVLLLDPLGKACAIDWLIEHERRVDPVTAQGRNGVEDGRRPTSWFSSAHKALWHEAVGRPVPSPARGPCWSSPVCGQMIPQIIRMRSLFINEHEARRVKPSLVLLPLLASPGHLGPQLLGGQYAFFEA
jgi:hypothetical protein